MGSRRDPKCVFNFLRFFERTLYKSNYIIFISSWCWTHTKIRSKLVDIVTARSQKITLWLPQRTPLGILRVNLGTRWSSSHISRQSTHEGSKVVSRMQRQPLHAQEIFLVLICVRCWVDPRALVRAEGLSTRKISMTKLGIRPATFRLVAQCLNQLHCRVFLYNVISNGDSSVKTV